MPERETGFNPEAEKGESTVGEIVEVLVGDFGEEIREDSDGLDFGDALGAAYGLLIQMDLDPDEYFASKHLILNIP